MISCSSRFRTKESSGDEGYNRYEDERDYHPTLQSFELTAEPICGIAIAHCPDT
jgi:hypothetical protein